MNVNETPAKSTLWVYIIALSSCLFSFANVAIEMYRLTFSGTYENFLQRRIEKLEKKGF